MIPICSQNLNLKYFTHWEKEHTWRHRRILYTTFAVTKCSLGNWIKLLVYSQLGLFKILTGKDLIFANIKRTFEIHFFFCLQRGICLTLVIKYKTQSFMCKLDIFIGSYWMVSNFNSTTTAYLQGAQHWLGYIWTYGQPQGFLGLVKEINRLTNYEIHGEHTNEKCYFMMGNFE